MSKNILITGGAGFIGSHVADNLIAHGYNVRILDNLLTQIHGKQQKIPHYLNTRADFQFGDVRDPRAVRHALRNIDAVLHFAAAVGVGQSMYEVKNYVSINNLGTSVLLEELINHPVEKLLVASSMSIYGEGLYKTKAGDIVHGKERNREQFRKGKWELCDDKGNILLPVATHELKAPAFSSIYAQSKFDQEQMCLIIGNAYTIPVIALRFFNVYGPRQSLSNPYTGVLAIFASRLLNDKPPKIFEDGLQKRDFVSVYDVAQACRKALESTKADKQKIFNIGSGSHYTVSQVALHMARIMGKDYIQPEVLGNYRVGDIRHCFADITKARQILKYEPCISFADGLKELSQWLEGQYAEDLVDTAHAELAERGLTI